MLRSIRLLFAAAAAALVLGGCATGYRLDNQVQSFSQLTALPAQPTYRFERVLSQQGDPAQQALEVFADPALHKAGLRRDDGSPRFSVQVSARAQRTLSPYTDPWSGWGWPGGWGVGYAHRGFGIGFSGPFFAGDPYWIHREVNVIVRELATGRIVYETRAINDGPWLDDRSVLPAMFDAAMQGFPTPPPGPRRVDLQVGARSP
jgi:Domain of unknown function (DUF4136)